MGKGANDRSRQIGSELHRFGKKVPVEAPRGLLNRDMDNRFSSASNAFKVPMPFV